MLKKSTIDLFKRTFIIALVAASVASCTAVEMAVEDRGSGDIGKDIKIKAALTKDVVQAMGTDVIKIDADVYEQDVLLTGLVETRAQKSRAEQLADNVEGVKSVYNEILVIPPVDRRKGKVENFIEDTVIEAKIKALLIDATGVHMTNLRWQSVEGQVVLFGRALSSAERAKAEQIVRGVQGVVSVKNLIKVKPKT